MKLKEQLAQAVADHNKTEADKNKANADYDKANTEIKRIAGLISQGESK